MRSGLICHSDAGGQYVFIAYTDRLDDIGASPSIDTVGDSLDCEHDPPARWVSETMLVGCRRAAA